MANNPPNTSSYAADMNKLLDLNRKHEHWVKKVLLSWDLGSHNLEHNGKRAICQGFAHGSTKVQNVILRWESSQEEHQWHTAKSPLRILLIYAYKSH